MSFPANTGRKVTIADSSCQQRWNAVRSHNRYPVIVAGAGSIKIRTNVQTQQMILFMGPPNSIK